MGEIRGVVSDNTDGNVEHGDEDSENEITIYNDRQVDHIAVTIDDEQRGRILNSL